MIVDYLASLFESHPIMWLVASLFIFNLGITILEIIIDLLTKKARRWKDSLANFAIFVSQQLFEKTVFASISFIALLPFFFITPLHIPMTVWSWILALFVADFTYYWMHRLEHKCRIMWASHSVHHSSEDYNLTVSFRLSLVEGLFEWAFLVPMVLMGFNPFQVIVALVLIAQYQHWIHTERIGKLGLLDEIFNTPSVHRVHHGSNSQYLDKNYGGVLMIWDKMFGTFERENTKVIYGLTRNINTNNPVKITFMEFGYIFSDFKKCRNNRDRIKIIFGGLSWRPKYFNKPNIEM